jgi:hypothetical protein
VEVQIIPSTIIAVGPALIMRRVMRMGG